MTKTVVLPLCWSLLLGTAFVSIVAGVKLGESEEMTPACARTDPGVARLRLT